MTRVLLSAIAFSEGTQVRASIDAGLVGEYADAMTEGAVFPPVVVFHDGNHYYLADGFHRFLAAQRLEARDITADVRAGTKADALWFALGANRKNGKRLSDTDKRHAIVLALQTWPERSGREIAEQVGCANTFVSRVRSEVCTSAHLPDHVTGKDGKRYPASRQKAASGPVVPPTSQRARADVEQRLATVRPLAADGHTIDQVAQITGLPETAIRSMTHRHGIAWPAHEAVGKRQRLDANRIVSTMAIDAGHLTAQVDLIDFSALDRAELAGWLEEFRAAHRSLGVFIRRLEKEVA